MREIKGTTRVCGLIGNPVEHSMSPMIHNNLANMCDIDLAYGTFKVEGDAVDTAIKGAHALNILGLNVTVPHKNAVIDSLVDIDPLAKSIGAVNTLVRVEGGYKGYNTDIIGINRELQDEGISITNQKVIILGAGGAAKAIAFLCAKEQAKSIVILNRTVDKARHIAEAVNEEFGADTIQVLALDEFEQLEGGDYLTFQTTSVGLYPNCEDVVISDEAFYKKVSFGVDIIYNPANTKFMQLVKENGGHALNGLKMLLYQGVSAFELWNNISVSPQDCKVVYELMKKELNIVE